MKSEVDMCGGYLGPVAGRYAFKLVSCYLRQTVHKVFVLNFTKLFFRLYGCETAIYEVTYYKQ